MINNIKVNKEPWLAAILSMYISGAGQIYLQSKKKGSLIFISWSMFSMYGIWSIVSYHGNTILGYCCIGIAIVINVWNVFDAMLSARKNNNASFEASRLQTKDPLLTLFLSFILPGTGHLYVKEYYFGLFVFGLYLFTLIMLEPNFYFQCGLQFFWGYIAFHACYAGKCRDVSFKTLKLLIFFSILIEISMISIESIFNTYFVTYAVCEGNSGSPTVKEGDIVLEEIRGNIKRGSLVSIRGGANTHNNVITKRILAFGGESIEINEGVVYVNGMRVKIEQIKSIKYYTDSTCYLATPGNPYRVPQGYVFVLGDNSKSSTDSRQFGPIKTERIISTVYKIIWPISSIKNL